MAEAVRDGMEQIGFSSHGPLPFHTSWSIDPDELPIYIRTVRNLKTDFRDRIEILLGLEQDYIPGLSNDFNTLRKDLGLDFIIGAVHLIANPETDASKISDLWFIDGPFEGYEAGLAKVFDADIKAGVRAYYRQVAEMALTQKPDIIAHFDKVKMNNKGRFFLESEAWYIEAVAEALTAVKEAGSIIEVNTRGIYRKKCRTYFPSPEILHMALQLGIPVTLSSDAHQPAESRAYFREACEDLTAIGYKSVMVYSEGNWVEESIG